MITATLCYPWSGVSPRRPSEPVRPSMNDLSRHDDEHFAVASRMASRFVSKSTPAKYGLGYWWGGAQRRIGIDLVSRLPALSWLYTIRRLACAGQRIEPCSGRKPWVRPGDCETSRGRI